MEEIARHSHRAYRALVYETEGFAEYFFSATPIAEIMELNIGSRPAARRFTGRIEDLRAIPWVFSWGQCRILLPGWYGFGSGVEAWLGRRQRADAAAARGVAGEDGARVAVFPHAAVEHGNGACEGRSGDRRTLRAARSSSTARHRDPRRASAASGN